MMMTKLTMHIYTCNTSFTGVTSVLENPQDFSNSRRTEEVNVSRVVFKKF